MVTCFLPVQDMYDQIAVPIGTIMMRLLDGSGNLVTLEDSDGLSLELSVECSIPDPNSFYSLLSGSASIVNGVASISQLSIVGPVDTTAVVALQFKVIGINPPIVRSLEVKIASCPMGYQTGNGVRGCSVLLYVYTCMLTLLF